MSVATPSPLNGFLINQVGGRQTPGMLTVACGFSRVIIRSQIQYHARKLEHNAHNQLKGARDRYVGFLDAEEKNDEKSSD